jgi:hypothetical protein
LNQVGIEIKYIHDIDADVIIRNYGVQDFRAVCGDFDRALVIMQWVNGITRHDAYQGWMDVSRKMVDNGVMCSYKEFWRI